MNFDDFDMNNDAFHEESVDPSFIPEEEYLYDVENDQYDEDLDDDYSDYDNDDEDIDDVIEIDDIDFSALDGKSLKGNLKQLSRATANKRVAPRKVSSRNPRQIPSSSKKPLIKRNVSPTKRPITSRVVKQPSIKQSKPLSSLNPVTKRPQLNKNGRPVPFSSKKPLVNVPVKKRATIHSKGGRKTTERILVPSDRKVIVEGVDKFILSNNPQNDAIKNIGYYKGKKLKELVLIINNDTPNDFDIELFNPSAPLDWLHSTSQNLNNMIQVAGDNKVSYSDLLFNLTANPTLLPNAKFVVAGAQVTQQFNQPMIFKNKNIAGQEKVHPIQNQLNIDIDQNQNQIVYWDIMETLGRAFIPNGMDVMQYKVLAGNQVIFGFYYLQADVRRFFFPESRDKNIL